MGRRINALDFSQTDWNTLKHNERDLRRLSCIECGGLLIPRSGHKIRQHFYHKHENINCRVSSKPIEHLFLQQLIFKIGVDLGFKPELETEIPMHNSSKDHRHADVCFEAEKKIVEIQLSQQSFEDYTERTSDYKNAGYGVLWLSWKHFFPELPIVELLPLIDGHTITRKDQIVDADDFNVYAYVVDGYEDPIADIDKNDLKQSTNIGLDLWERFHKIVNDESRYGFQISRAGKPISLGQMIYSYLTCNTCNIIDFPHFHGEVCQEASKSKIDYNLKIEAWKELEFNRQLQIEAEKRAYESERKEWAAKYRMTISDLDKAVEERSQLIESIMAREKDRIEGVINRYREIGEEIPYFAKNWDKKYVDWKSGFDKAIKVSPDNAFFFMCNSCGIEKKASFTFVKYS